MKTIYTFIFTFFFASLALTVFPATPPDDPEKEIQQEIKELNKLVEQNNYYLQMGDTGKLIFFFGNNNVEWKKPFFSENIVTQINEALRAIYYQTGIQTYLGLNYKFSATCDTGIVILKSTYEYQERRVFNESLLGENGNSRAIKIGMAIFDCAENSQPKFIVKSGLMINIVAGDDVKNCNTSITKINIDPYNFVNNFDAGILQFLGDVGNKIIDCNQQNYTPLEYAFTGSVNISNSTQLNFYNYNVSQTTSNGVNVFSDGKNNWINNTGNTAPNYVVNGNMVDYAGLTDQQQQQLEGIINSVGPFAKVYFTSTNNTDAFNLVKQEFETGNVFAGSTNKHFAYWFHFDLNENKVYSKVKLSDRIYQMLKNARLSGITLLEDEQLNNSVNGFLDFLINNYENYKNDQPWDFQPLFYSLFQYNQYVLGFLENLKLPDAMWKPTDPGYSKYNWFHGTDVISQCQSAYFCGFFNGLAAEGTDIVSLGIMAQNLIYDKNMRDQMMLMAQQYATNQGAFIGKMLQELWQQTSAGYTQDLATGFYSAGKHTEFIVSCFVGLGEISAFAKSGKLMDLVANAAKFVDFLKSTGLKISVVADKIIIKTSKTARLFGEFVQKSYFKIEADVFKTLDELGTTIKGQPHVYDMELMVMTPRGNYVKIKPTVVETYSGEEFLVKPDNMVVLDDVIDYLVRQFGISQQQAIQIINKNLDNVIVAKGLPLKAMEATARKALVDDFLELGVDYIDVFDRNIITSWDVLYKAGRKELRKSKTTLQLLNELISNNNLGLTKPDFEKIFTKHSIYGKPGNKVMDEDGVQNIITNATLSADDLLISLKQLSNSNILGKEKLAKNLCCNIDKKYIGAEFQLRHIIANINEVEEIEKIAPNRIIDVFLKSGAKRNELKSWSTFSKKYWTSSINEFAKDLSDIQRLDELRWVFDAKGQFTNNAAGLKYLKDNFMEMISSPQGRGALQQVDLTKIQQLFDDFLITESNKVQTIVDYLNDVNNFNKILKIY